MNPSYFYNLAYSISYKNIGDDVDYCILVRDEKIYLFFQGTRTKRDWINNINFPCKLYKNQKSCLLIARGWGNAYKSCNDEIMEELIETTKQFPDYPVFIIGHSLGGAMSLLASEDYFFRTGRKADVITFGSPKPLFGMKSKKYVRNCCNSIKQYVHVHDIVPTLPPFFGYTGVEKTEIGNDKWKFWKMFEIPKWHLSYGEEDLYNKDF